MVKFNSLLIATLSILSGVSSAPAPVPAAEPEPQYYGYPPAVQEPSYFIRLSVNPAFTGLAALNGYVGFRNTGTPFNKLSFRKANADPFRKVRGNHLSFFGPRELVLSTSGSALVRSVDFVAGATSDNVILLRSNGIVYVRSTLSNWKAWVFCLATNGQQQIYWAAFGSNINNYNTATMTCGYVDLIVEQYPN